MTLKIRGKLLNLNTPVVMGIINLTNDSFYSESRVDDNLLMQRVEKMISEGASILDLGAYSTRPGAIEIPIEEETKKIVNAVTTIKREFPEVILSIDTFRSQVAESALDAGAEIINDVSGGDADHDMFNLIIKKNCPYILMHMRGTPQTMQSLTEYKNVTEEVVMSLAQKVRHLRNEGVSDLIADPGFGFAKTVEQNYEMLKNLAYFKEIGVPLLVGVSRKSMIYKPLGVSSKEALNGTTALNMIALEKGANILRVHDVKEAVECIKLFNLINT
ncbi:dihydropteroate synthase [Marinigracilibium pacificum]|uniref:dihydropteroate synthase n=1 Tax=Marinigracilibium pacificum TaxID=2729599 RepID=A0A848J2Q2_9BACT|nr:dihydropteroate synthase [Marinigracilibium pacificum]NMM48820.1 dihydropteroate synthase [Marinigracilibium pacificum]